MQIIDRHDGLCGFGSGIRDSCAGNIEVESTQLSSTSELPMFELAVHVHAAVR